MRRSDKEITDPGIIAKIIGCCHVCRLGLARDNIPYIVPLSFGYDGAALYVHTAKTGKKIECFEANPTVCLEFESGVTLKPHEDDPCSWSFSYQSVIGYGVIRELTDPAEMISALQLIMKQYSEQEWSFTRESIAALRVWKISIKSLSGKQSKDMVMP
jgi:nitroimidazol reductase NimA-like FMN-containing flavoprotein (pyridoxamine 5'-phosphate oxidase superfamily)